MLTKEEKQYVYLQQHNATAHPSQHSVEALYGISGERIINH
jgi:hypothetical protein